MAIMLCLELPELPDPFAIQLPGGIEIEDINLMQMIQPALTPLVPFFEIIDVLVSILNCLQAIPSALGPPPDPTVLTACLPDLAKQINKLLRMIPQLSLPILVRRLIELLIKTLVEVRSKVLHLQQQMVQILGAIDRAKNLEDAGLMAIAQCAQANVAQELANVGKSLASLGKLIGLVNMFMGMFGGPQVPDFKTLAGRPLDEILPPLDALIAQLRTIQNAVPVP